LRQLLAVQAAQIGRALMLSSSGKGRSELPVADEVGQLVQARGALAEDGEGVAGVGAQFVGIGAGAFQAEQAT
jgi:hypothetical protein